MDNKVKIFAKELCELLKKHKMGGFDGQFTPGFGVCKDVVVIPAVINVQKIK